MKHNFWKKNGATIVSCLGAIGVVVTVIVTADATIKAEQVIFDAEEEKGEELTKGETVKAVAPTFLPVVVSASVTIGCIFGSNVLSRKQQMALIGAYGLINESYRKYQDKVRELHGEEVHEEIMSEIVKEEAKKTHITAPGGFRVCNLELDEENTSKPVLFYDSFGNRYFEATIEQVMAAEYYSNRDFCIGSCVLLNDFYDFLGIGRTKIGEEIAWCADDGLLWIDFDHYKTVLEDGLEVYVIDSPYPPSQEWKEYLY